METHIQEDYILAIIGLLSNHGGDIFSVVRILSTLDKKCNKMLKDRVISFRYESDYYTPTADTSKRYVLPSNILVLYPNLDNIYHPIDKRVICIPRRVSCLTFSCLSVVMSGDAIQLVAGLCNQVRLFNRMIVDHNGNGDLCMMLSVCYKKDIMKVEVTPKVVLGVAPVLQTMNIEGEVDMIVNVTDKGCIDKIISKSDEIGRLKNGRLQSTDLVDDSWYKKYKEYKSLEDKDKRKRHRLEQVYQYQKTDSIISLIPQKNDVEGNTLRPGDTVTGSPGIMRITSAYGPSDSQGGPIPITLFPIRSKHHTTDHVRDIIVDWDYRESKEDESVGGGAFNNYINHVKSYFMPGQYTSAHATYRRLYIKVNSLDVLKRILDSSGMHNIIISDYRFIFKVRGGEGMLDMLMNSIHKGLLEGSFFRTKQVLFRIYK